MFDPFDVMESHYYVLTKYPRLFSREHHIKFDRIAERRRFKPGLFIMTPSRDDRIGMRFNAAQLIRMGRCNRSKIKNG